MNTSEVDCFTCFTVGFFTIEFAILNGTAVSLLSFFADLTSTLFLLALFLCLSLLTPCIVFSISSITMYSPSSHLLTTFICLLLMLSASTHSLSINDFLKFFFLVLNPIAPVWATGVDFVFFTPLFLGTLACFLGLGVGCCISLYSSISGISNGASCLLSKSSSKLPFSLSTALSSALSISFILSNCCSDISSGSSSATTTSWASS
eukprot:NODE_24_length_36516_cov_0.652470.p16 type:complete len:206 gc:universal NODE_24_length_36516_cov_0.652470:28997-28380(-)